MDEKKVKRNGDWSIFIKKEKHIEGWLEQALIIYPMVDPR